MIDEFNLGTYIRKGREALGLSQEELCEGLCAVSTLSRIENNQQDPSRHLTMSLLGRLGLPQDKFISFWGQRDISAGALMREILNDMVRYHRTAKEKRPQIVEQVQGKLAELETAADPNSRSIQQFILTYKAQLEHSTDKRLAMQLKALRLTCPKFDPEDFQHGHYNMHESRLINQIATTYLDAGQRKRAIGVYRQLLWYVEKNCQELTNYASLFCLIAHNYAIALGLEGHYTESVEIAEQGRKACVYYGVYQFLPGFLAVQAESGYHLGETDRSRELYLQAYYVYQAFGDEISREHMRQEMKDYLGIEMPR